MTVKVWSWRQAILQSPLTPTTKLVLLVLSTYMNEHGGGCYPSVPEIMAGSSLKRRTVFEHLNLAEDAGFLKRSKQKRAGQEWAHNEYHATYPAQCTLANEGVRLMHPSPEKPVDSSVDKSVDDIGVNDSRGAPSRTEGCAQPHTNSPVDHSNTTTEENAKEKGKGILDAFRAALTEVRGEEQGKKWFAGSKDHQLAAGWEMRGLRVETARNLFNSRQKQRRDNGGKPIVALAYFNDPVEGLLTVPKQLPAQKLLDPRLVALNREYTKALRANDKPEMRKISASIDELKKELAGG